MARRIAVLAALGTVAAGLVSLELSPPAHGAVTLSSVTLPADGTTFTITDSNPPVNNIPVQGSTNGTPVSDLVDIRCYYNEYNWDTILENVVVSTGGSFATFMSSGMPYGTCVVRAVPDNLPAGSDLTPYAGSRVTTNWVQTDTVGSGPNADRVVDYYVISQGSHALNDYGSASASALLDTRLQLTNGHSGSYLWNGTGGWRQHTLSDGRSDVQVDGHDAYGPYTASVLFAGSKDYPGLPELTYDATLGSTTVIHESNPIVRCTSDTFPPTSGSCTAFLSTGVRLDRTIVTDDGGRQTHISDRWVSTDGQVHTVSVHYRQGVSAWDQNSDTPTTVGLKLPWISSTFLTSSPATYAGPPSLPSSILVRQSNTAVDGDTNLPRGAVTFDRRPSTVNRTGNGVFQLREHSVTIPAGGSALVRHDYVIGATDAEVAAKAAASRARLNPYRPDGLIRKPTTSYVGNNVYNATGSGQTVAVRKKRGKRATFLVKVQNDGTVTDSFRLLGTGKRKGFAVTYLAGTSGSTDITASVRAGTYTLANLLPGQERVVRLVVKVKATAKRGIRRSWFVTARSVGDTTRADVTAARVRVRR